MTAVREAPVRGAVSAERGPARRPFTGAMRRSHLNRALSFALGAVLIAAGSAGAVAAAARAGVPAAGGLDLLSRPAPVPPALLPYAVGAGALAAVVLGVWWLSAQRDTARLRGIVRGTDSVSGLTVLSGNALAGAVAGTAERLPGVVRARARLLGPDSAPWLRLEATLDPDADLGGFLDACRGSVVEALRMSLDVPAVPTLVVVSVGGDTSRGRAR